MIVEQIRFDDFAAGSSTVIQCRHGYSQKGAHHLQIQGTQSGARRGESMRMAWRALLAVLLILAQAASSRGSAMPASYAQRLVKAAIARTASRPICPALAS